MNTSRIIFFCLLCFTHVLSSQTIPSNISPALLSQIQSMSPEDQKLYAERFGINLDNYDKSLDTSSIGLPGTPITPRDRDAYNPIESELNLSASPTPILILRENPPLNLKNSLFDEDLFQEEERIVRFGDSIFNQKVSTFAPTDDSPVPETYRLGPGDELVIQMYGSQNNEFRAEIQRDGSLSFPKVGSISLAGLTFEDARDVIKSAVANKLLGVDLYITIGRLKAIGIFISGEVQTPGAYSVSGYTTITQALFQAGGITDIGSLRNIQVLRNGNVINSIDIYDLLLSGDASKDIKLQSSDVVFVPPYAGLVSVEGEVNRPMTFEIKENDTVQDILKMSAGLTQRAFQSNAILTSSDLILGGNTIRSINLSDPVDLTILMSNGDKLSVLPRGERLATNVSVIGAITRTGEYGWFEGMRVSNIVTNIKADTLLETDLLFGLIVRVTNELEEIDTLKFSLLSALKFPNTSQDPILQEMDQVIFFTKSVSRLDDDEPLGEGTAAELSEISNDKEKSDLESENKFLREVLLKPVLSRLLSQASPQAPANIISISGAVKHPGIYPLFLNATAKDLIAAAGGLKQNAYSESAELRSIVTQDNNRLNETEYTEISLNDVLKSLNNPLLSSRDHITVREISNWNPDDSILLEGEVLFPGTYLIKRNESLLDAVNRAGGFTQEAFVEGAIFSREDLALKESAQSKQYANKIRTIYSSSLLTSETINTNFEDFERVAKLLEDFEGRGRLIVDIKSAEEGNKQSNIRLINGDSLFIPRFNSSISIMGEVNEPGSFTLSDGLRVEDVIALAGGLTARANPESAYIVRANGSSILLDKSSFRLFRNKPILNPGDTIVVPIDFQYKEDLTLWTDITQIIYQSMVSIAAIKGL